MSGVVSKSGGKCCASYCLSIGSCKTFHSDVHLELVVVKSLIRCASGNGDSSSSDGKLVQSVAAE